jgi:hypothetical protein
MFAAAIKQFLLLNSIERMGEERTSCPGRGNCLNCVNGIKIKNLQM